ncbi:MAG: phosphate ABC transporter ATP-binding protein PstB [Nitrososphaerales archaeon]
MDQEKNSSESSRIEISDLNVFYQDNHVLKNVSLEIEEKQITVIMGPSGCGKSTLIRVLNRMNDNVVGFKRTGKVTLGGKNIYDRDVDPTLLKTRVGMVFQKPNPFPISIFENVAFGPKIHKMHRSKQELDDMVKTSLERAALWDEVKDRLKENAMRLSGGQQQRLCIARTLAVRPQVLLLDEPASALDPGATAKIDELMFELKKNYTVVLVTHNMQQAARVANNVAFLYKGELVEVGESPSIFETPAKELTEKYISGKLV